MYSFSAASTTVITTEFFPPLIKEPFKVDESPVPLKTGAEPGGGNWPEQEIKWGTWGDDYFVGGKHTWEDTPTHYAGNAGVDTVDYAHYSTTPSDAVNINLNLGVSLSLSGRSMGDTFESIENIIGSRWDDVIAGDDRLIGNMLDGDDGRDILFGNAGDDMLIGGLGIDTQSGGAGDDIFRFFYGHSSSSITPDVIRDFDQNGDDVLEFVFDVPADSDWRAEAWELNGSEGTMVFGTEFVSTNPFDRYAVFLEGTDVSDIGADDFVFL